MGLQHMPLPDPVRMLTVDFPYRERCFFCFLHPGLQDLFNETLTVYTPATANVSTPDASIVPLSTLYTIVPGACLLHMSKHLPLM
jgi:hypothetical protein